MLSLLPPSATGPVLEGVCGGAIIRAPRILIISKVEKGAGLVADALREEGYTVFTVGGTAEGMDRLRENRPDLIIMDDGLQTKGDEDAIRQIRQGTYLPILVLGRRHETVEALERGADAFLSRPPHLGELKARVRVLLRRTTSRNLRLNDSNRTAGGPGAVGLRPVGRAPDGG